MERVLILGGTGMLADAVREIAMRGVRLTLIARSPERLAAETGATPLPMDWTREASVLSALALLRAQEAVTVMISWIHPAGLWCLSAFEWLLAPGGRSIRVHGSAAGDPRNGVKTDPLAPAHVTRQNLVLGWVNEARGRRWLSHREISAGVICAYDTPGQPAFIVGELT